MHDNYGPVVWGGTGERWDLLQLERAGPLDGGDQLRRLIKERMTTTVDSERPLKRGLTFRGDASITARGAPLKVSIDSEGRSWALASDLMERYDIPYAWDADQRRILIGALDVAPTYRDDGVQASVGWPLVSMALQTGNAPVILTGIVRPSASGDRAWCRVLEFAEEFGISTRFGPFTLLERRGG